MERNNYKNSTVIVRIVCAILFCLFSFIYLYKYQAEILTIAQHVLSNGQTHYNHLIGAILITLVLFLLELGVFAITRFPNWFHALTYFPSMLTLAVITDVSPRIDRGFSFGAWLWVYPLLLILFAGFCWFAKQLSFMDSDKRHIGWFSRVTWVNLLVMLVMMMIVGQVSNDDTVFHYRMRAEKHILNKEYDEVLNVGKKSLECDSSLTMLRAYALSQKNLLGERLFTYPLCGGAAALLPDNQNVRALLLDTKDVFLHIGRPVRQPMKPLDYLLFMTESEYGKKAAADYLLCGFLLEKRLDLFVKHLKKHYELSEETLPRHYREALILYNHHNKNLAVPIKDNVLETDYQDFRSLMKQISNTIECKNKARDVYGNTYWYYYHFG